MKDHDLWPGLFFMGVGLSAAVLASRLGIGDIGNPGPGLIPFGVAVLLGLMSMGMLVGSLVRPMRSNQKESLFEGINWKTPVLVVCVLLGYGIAFNTLGFVICTFLLMVILLGVVGRRKWRLTLVISVLTTVSAYLLFVSWLGCQFPKGPFGI